MTIRFPSLERIGKEKPTVHVRKELFQKLIENVKQNTSIHTCQGHLDPMVDFFLFLCFGTKTINEEVINCRYQFYP